MAGGDGSVQLVGSSMGFVDSTCLHVVANLGMADAVDEAPMLLCRRCEEAVETRLRRNVFP